MTVYADVIFAVNTIVNYLLLLLGARLTGYFVRLWKVLLGAAVGGLYAVCAVIPAMAFSCGLFGKFVSFLVMVVAAYGVRKNAVRPAVVMILCSGALAGFIYFITHVFSVGIVILRGHVYYPMASKVLVLLAGGFYLAAALLMSGSMKHKTNEIVQLSLCAGGRCVQVNALYDTGLTLNDPISGKPVVILEWHRCTELLGVSVVKELFRDAANALLWLKESCSQCGARLVPYCAVGTECGMLVAIPCKMKIRKNRELSVLAAISPNAVSDGGGYEALIGGNAC